MIIFCLADTRSGTTAIARCFHGATAFVNLGEIFYEDGAAMGHYVELHEQANSPALERFDEYLDFLRSDTKHLYWLDIKFHDLNRFNPRQLAITAQPRLLQRIVKGGDPTILIGRANPLRATSSQVQAMMSGTFHVARSDELDRRSVTEKRDWSRTIDAIRTALERQAEFRVVEGHLRKHPKLFQIDYEALFDCPEAADNRAILGAWIGADAINQPDLVKVSSDWPGWFDYNLAREILQGTCGQWWIS